MDYSFNDIFVSEGELTIENIISKVSELVLWRHYMDTDFTLGKVICSPLRIDKNPSFCIFLGKRNNILYKDFGTKDTGNIFHFIQAKYNISFYQTLLKINADFGLKLGKEEDNKFNSDIKINKPNTKEIENFVKEFVKSNVLFEVKPRKLNSQDILYWKKFGVDESILNMYHVYCVDTLYKDKQVIYSYNSNNPCYAYYFPRSKHIKCYFPFHPDKSKKFCGNVNNFEDIQGYYQCNVKENYEGKFLVLTKSMKDCMTLRSFGIDSMAIHGETHKFYSDFIRHIKKYYSHIVSLYDRDKTGILAAKELWKEYNIPPFFINKKYQCKDISDLYDQQGKEKVEDFLKKLRK